MLLAINSGNWNVKVAWDGGYELFDSCLGDGRKLNLENNYIDEMVVNYAGQHMFAGVLAEYESVFPRRSFGLSKAHDDMKIRTLIAVHRFGKGDNFDLMVGQPIKRHDEANKEKIKDLLLGVHEIEVNGVKKRFNISSVNVGAEGASVYWTLKDHEPAIRIVDIGSGTINIATIRDGFFIDKESTTLPFGTNRVEDDVYKLASAVNSALTSVCDVTDKLYLCGGIANYIFPLIHQQYPKAQTIEPEHMVNGKREKVTPEFANAIGLYNLGTVLHPS